MSQPPKPLKPSGPGGRGTGGPPYCDCGCGGDLELKKSIAAAKKAERDLLKQQKSSVFEIAVEDRAERAKSSVRDEVLGDSTAGG